MNTVQNVKAGNKIKFQGLLYHYFEGSERATLLYDFCFIIENYLSEKKYQLYDIKTIFQGVIKCYNL